MNQEVTIRAILRKSLLPAALIGIGVTATIVSAFRLTLFSSDYLPHRYCYRAQPALIWTNVVADGLIAIAYTTIFSCLVWMVYKIRAVYPLRRYLSLLVSFGIFILACGATHALELLTVWHPYYPLAAAVKVLCACASVPTAIVLARITPRLIRNAFEIVKIFTKTVEERDQATVERDKTRESLELALMVANGIGVWEWHVQEDRLFADATVAAFFAMDAMSAANGATLETFMRSVHDDDRERVHAAILQGTLAGNVYALEYRLIAGGGERWVENRGHCTHDKNGLPMLFNGVAIDITSRKRRDEALALAEALKSEAVQALARAESESLAASAALAETKKHFRLLVEGVDSHALLTVDTGGFVTSWNHGAERLLGYTEDQIVGRNFSCLSTPDDVAAGIPPRQLATACHAGRAEDEGWRVRADGSRFWAVVNETAFFEDTGELRGLTVVIQDTTEKKKIALALEAVVKDRLRLQEAFLSNVSHELRTPLTAIYFFVTNVTDGLLGEVVPEQLDQLLLALENVTQLKAMVGDLLEITRVDSLKLAVDPRRAEAGPMVMDVLSTCRKNAKGKDIVIRSEIASELPPIWADRHRVRQILTNLVDNAIKFTPAGGSIVVAVKEFAGDHGFLHFSVSDTGCGISPVHLDLIFDRLAQVKNGLESSREGLGIGLFIAKDLVTRHGGSMWVESVLGQGSTFFFTLPLSSLAGHCSAVLKAARAGTGEVAVIALELVTDTLGDAPASLQALTRLVERCLHPNQDVILPHPDQPEEGLTLLILASTGSEGAAAIAKRIELELQTAGKTVLRQLNFATQVLQLDDFGSPDQQESAMIAHIEEFVQKHRKVEESAI